LLTHPTLDLLHQLGLKRMAKAFAEVEASSEATSVATCLAASPLRPPP
jgi:hypothetical protein